MQPQRPPHVVIIGGGFGGLYAAKALRRAPVRITLIDRTNYHLFQPLLYEVATAALSPADIAAPIRRIFARQKNTTVLMGHVTSIDTANCLVHLTDGVIDYDYLVVAAGATHSYFGNEQAWSKLAPGLKTIQDAVEIRGRFLLAFEAAEREADPAARRAKLTFVIVGAGPTGMELAGTMSELARKAIPHDFRAIDTTTARVILIEAMDRVLPNLAPDLSAKALKALRKLGVEVRLNSPVSQIDGEGVWIGAPEAPQRERIDAENVIWAAGVQASPLGATLGVPLDAHGRVIVQPDLSIANHPEVFVIGDMAKVMNRKTGREVLGVAPAAIQMGKFVARVIRHETSKRRNIETSKESQAAGKPQMPDGDFDVLTFRRFDVSPRPAFAYFDKGLLATIGRGKAVGYVNGFHLSGAIAWFMWAFIHIMYLIGFRNRIMVMLQWAWTYLIWQRGARLITGSTDLDLHRPRTDQTEAQEIQITAAHDPSQGRSVVQQ